ncbi:MAG: hypothetical protein WEA99_14905, partial [Brumimicrobium sp.]
SGFAIHHQNDQNKKRIYKTILNLDQVASSSTDLEKLFDEYFLESMELSLRDNPTDTKIEDIQTGYYADKELNKLAPVGKQLNWLEEIGFGHVDCYFKNMELSLFGGIKK